MKKLLIILVLVGLAIGGTSLYGRYKGSEIPIAPFRTSKVSRGDLLITVSATGTVEPEEIVDVGAQVVGRIKELGKDPRGKTDPKFADKNLDFGSPVEQGMLIAQIDPSIYQAQHDQADASLTQAKANVLQMEAKLMQAEAEWKRAQRLRSLKLTNRSPTGSSVAGSPLPIKGISDADFILAQANFESARANVKVAEGTVLQQQASLELAKTNLGYTTIKSPVSGTVIDRRVNIGQTVVSSLSAPSLFLIARDLRRMQVWASVNEADIGRLSEGTKVHFRTDAFPDDVFRGVVAQIRLNASFTSNVVTYTVVISVDNSDLKLLPYLTAAVKFEVNERHDVLAVPNAALRFKPKPTQVANRPAVDKSGPKDSSKGDAPILGEPVEQFNLGTLWVMDAETKLLSPITVRTGLSDGSFTEIDGDELAEGVEVVLGENTTVASADMVNPLGPPKFFRGKKK